MLILRCPKCRNKMKYQSSDGYIAKKVKKCVYCGHSFKVSNSVIGKAEK